MPSHNFVMCGHGKGGRAVFSETEELDIAKRIAQGERKSDLATEKGVHRNTIRNIWTRRKGDLTVVAAPKEDCPASPPQSARG